MPEDYLSLDPNEKVLFKLHLHWIYIFPVFVSTVLIITGLSYLMAFLVVNQKLLPQMLSLPLIGSAITALSALTVVILVGAYLIYLQNRIILTDKHLLEITQNGLFSRTVSQLTLDEIQDVRGTKRGFWATILNYGEVLIETAGSEPNFLFKPVGNPLRLATLINDAHQRHGHKQ